jgi:hypothetical protein
MMPPPATAPEGSPRAPRPPPPLCDALADAAVQGTNDDATVSKLCAQPTRALRCARVTAACRRRAPRA